MCKGVHEDDTEMVRVWICPELSYTERGRWKDAPIDRCIAPLVRALQEGGINMTASCCGHGEGDGRIDLYDGRIIIIKTDVDK